MLRHIISNEKLAKEYLSLLWEFLRKYPGAFEGYFPGITSFYNSHKGFIETLFYGDLREFSLNDDNREVIMIIMKVAIDPAIGPERILSRDNNGRYYIIEKLKLFASLGLTNYAQYAVKFPEGTDIVLNSPKFIRLLKEGESALKEFGARTGEGDPTILSIISDIFAVLQVVSSSERKEIAGLFEGEYIYTLSALDIPYFIENYIVYPEATKLALDYGQLNRYYIELINESLGADKSKTEEGLRQGLYGKQLLAFVNGRVISENITHLREKRKKDNEQIRKEVIAEINSNPDFLESSLLDILSRAKEHGLIVSLLSGSSRNPLARYFLKDKFSKEELSKRTKNKDIDIRIKELLFSKDDLLNQSLGCSEEIISLLRERLGDRKIWIPAFEDSIESKIKRFDRAALENLHIKRYMDILDSSLGRELLRGKLASLYASNAAGADINKDKVREVFNQESSEEFMVLENVVALVKRLTLSRIQEAGIAVDIRGDYSAVTRGDTNINTIEIFYNKEGKLDIFDPELGLLDFKEGKVRISAGSQAIYGNHRPINVMVTSVSEVALGDALRLLRHKTQFGLEPDPEDVKVVKNGLALLTHKGNSKFPVDKIQRNAEKVFEFLHDEEMDSDQIRSLLENLGGIHSSYPFLFRNIFEGSMRAAADNVLYQYLSAEQRIRYLKGETVYFENIAIHQSGGTAQGEVFKEVPVESIIKDKGLGPGSGQAQTKGNPAVYLGTDSARSWGQRNNEILFIYDQQVLKALISGELKYGDKPLSEYGAYFNEATKHYVMSLPKEKEDVLPLRFAKVVYLTSELYIKAEAVWRRILNSAILEEVINNSQIPISNKHNKIAEVKTKLSEEYFGRSTEGNIKTFEDVFKNIFSVRFIKPSADTVLFMIADAVAYEEDGLAEELRSIAVEVFQKTNEEVGGAIKMGKKERRIFKEDEARVVSSAVERESAKELVSEIEELKQDGWLDKEEAVLLLAQEIPQILKMPEDEAELFIKIILDTSEKSLKEHIHEYHIRFEKEDIDKLDSLVNQAKKIIEEEQIDFSQKEKETVNRVLERIGGLVEKNSASSAVRISYEDLAAVLDPESRAREIINEMKNKHGKPYETKTIDIEGKKIEVINWFRALGAEEWQTIEDVLGKFRSIAGGEFLKEIYYLAIEPMDKPNPNAPDENLNGWGAVNGVFKLFPNAFNQEWHRVRGVPNLTGTLIHELGHIAIDNLVNAWLEEFPENGNDTDYITPYAKVNAKEDMAETMIAAILGIDYSQQVIVQEKINFLQKILGINPEQPFCLTPDSLITLADGTAKPLIELKPLLTSEVNKGEEEGDMVLSLNEGTGKLEPHRVLALLDMGVKPVYRLTTESGKTLKTTLTHPYLTKNGWRKLSEIRVGEEVAVVGGEALASVGSAANLNTFNKDGFGCNIKRNTIFAHAKTVSSGRQVNQRLGADERIFQRGVISQFSINTFLDFFRQALKFLCSAGRKLDAIHKEAYANPSSCSISLKGTQPFFFASAIDFLRERTKSGLRGNLDSILSISQPAGFTDLSWYSSVDNLSMMASSILESTSRSAGVSRIKIWGVPFLSTMTAAFEPLVSLNTERGASLLKGISFANFSFSGNNFIYPKFNIRTPTLSSSFLSEAEAAENSFVSSNSDLLWDKIISIEPLGAMPVYDIEVEATHNFIAQGILAHNTYTNADGKLPIANRKGETAGSALENKGGIDLNPQNLELEISTVGGAAYSEKGTGLSSSPFTNIPFDLQNFQGFTFQIISIQPAEGNVLNKLT